MDAIERGARAAADTDVPIARAAAPGGPWARWARSFVQRYFERLTHGCVILYGPGSTRAIYGDPAADLRATLTVHDPRFFRRTVAGGDIGFAEAYMEGDWDCDDLTALIEIFAVNRDRLDDLSLATALPRRVINRAYHWTRRNTPAGNRRNVQDHYDLGNEFFRLFLDPTMTYSCALFPRGTETLEQGQRLKIDAVLEKAAIRPGDHLLEIGSGWGSLAIAAARRTGCHVTTLTLSEEQKRWVDRRVAADDLQDLVDVRIADYRTIEGTFDRIVSVEMLEAVGHDNLPVYFAACERLLRAGGRAVIQVITIRDERYDEYRKGCDFIQRYIFPGGHLPCWGALQAAIGAASHLRVDNVEDIGHHYPATLRAWRAALEDNAQQVRALGFDDAFLRKWNYYFSYCEAGFRNRTLGNLQLVLGKSDTPEG
jgi:cyclopropane-fatty-acyl-phospholipid synthase